MTRSASSARSGFTLSEVLVTVIVIVILATIAIPSYTRTVERGYWRAAQDVLQTVYAGEQVYFTVNNAYLALAAGGPWTKVYTDDPNFSNPFVGRVTFNVTVAGATFTVRADRGGGKSMTINEAHTLCTGPPCTWPQP